MFVQVNMQCEMLSGESGQLCDYVQHVGAHKTLEEKYNILQ